MSGEAGREGWGVTIGGAAAAIWLHEGNRRQCGRHGSSERANVAPMRRAAGTGHSAGSAVVELLWSGRAVAERLVSMRVHAPTFAMHVRALCLLPIPHVLGP